MTAKYRVTYKLADPDLKDLRFIAVVESPTAHEPEIFYRQAIKTDTHWNGRTVLLIERVE
ncbi:MAG: hypothetical protein ACLQD9_03465 [Thermoplasmata archaeon]